MDKIEMWGIVDLFGHQKVAGFISEAQIGGCAFVRVDVPAVDGSQAVTHFYGNGAIYSMTPTSEELVRLFVKSYRPAPLSVYIPEIRQLEGEQLPLRKGRDMDEEEGEEEEWEEEEG